MYLLHPGHIPYAGQISGMVIGAVKLVNDGVPEGQISLK